MNKNSRRNIRIAPSILSANFLKLGEDIDMINNSNADMFHIDVMDGLFVPNISFGTPILGAVHKLAKKPLDVHLMIEIPERYIEVLHDHGADWISVHYETGAHLNRTINHIKELGMKAGVVLNPHSPVSLLAEIINDVDYVLLMSVNPGFGGQKFIPATLRKIRELRAFIDAKNINVLIEVDGGINQSNAGEVADAGADILVAGSAVFNAVNPIEAIDRMKGLL
ncbi:MAG: ribulose-phosphate 3-epimerase [Bacteroidales bacterium]|nr:ribulose-phosphate 3-epimerase [Bacteroidales bacterium]